MATNILVLDNKDFDQFIGVSQNGIKRVVNMSEIKYYQPGDVVDMKSGGIVWNGKLNLKNDASVSKEEHKAGKY